MRNIQLAVPFFALILLIPPGVLAQQSNEMGTDDIIDNTTSSWDSVKDEFNIP